MVDLGRLSRLQREIWAHPPVPGLSTPELIRLFQIEADGQGIRWEIRAVPGPLLLPAQRAPVARESEQVFEFAGWIFNPRLGPNPWPADLFWRNLDALNEDPVVRKRLWEMTAAPHPAERGGRNPVVQPLPASPGRPAPPDPGGLLRPLRRPEAGAGGYGA
ncbi:MAG: hypothetical protein QJR14_10465 [Bacillota bacterium]|nr:hypothetical protein [Bacillota bacterium]